MLLKLTFYLSECATICRKSTKDIKCDSDEIITISDVIFTSQSKNPASCFLEWTPVDICDNEISYKDLQDKCNGKQRCSVKMTYNPCTQKVLKYSKIVYTCTGNTQYHKILNIYVYNESRQIRWLLFVLLSLVKYCSHVLQSYSTKRTSQSSHWNITCSCHDLAAK
jgi:hypothetical protein